MEDVLMKIVLVSWLITTLTVAKIIRLEDTCPSYAQYFCACSLADIAEERQLKMCFYKNLGSNACHPCPVRLQEDVNCDSCDDGACPICSLYNFGAGTTYDSHIKQQAFLKFSRDHGIFYIKPLQDYPGHPSSHLPELDYYTLHEKDNDVDMPNSILPELHHSFETYSKNEAQEKAEISANTKGHYSGSNDRQHRFKWLTLENSQNLDHSKLDDRDKDISTKSLNFLEEAQNNKSFELTFPKLHVPGFETKESDANLSDSSYFETDNEKLKYNKRKKYIKNNENTNLLQIIPFEALNHTSFVRHLNNEQENLAQNLGDYIIPLHILGDDDDVARNIYGKIETHEGDKCEFIRVRNDSGIGDNSTIRLVNFQCSFRHEFSKLSFRDYLLDLFVIEDDTRKCIFSIYSPDAPGKFQLNKTNCNITLPLTFLFKYIHRAAGNKIESRKMNFVEAINMSDRNFTGKIEFKTEIVNLSPVNVSISTNANASDAKIYHNLNGVLKIDIKLHLKKSSDKNFVNKINGIGNFFSDIPIDLFTWKLKTYQIQNLKFKFSKDGMNIKVSLTHFPSFKIKFSIYELLQYLFDPVKQNIFGSVFKGSDILGNLLKELNDTKNFEGKMESGDLIDLIVDSIVNLFGNYTENHGWLEGFINQIANNNKIAFSDDGIFRQFYLSENRNLGVKNKQDYLDNKFESNLLHGNGAEKVYMNDKLNFPQFMADSFDLFDNMLQILVNGNSKLNNSVYEPNTSDRNLKTISQIYDRSSFIDRNVKNAHSHEDQIYSKTENVDRLKNLRQEAYYNQKSKDKENESSLGNVMPKNKKPFYRINQNSFMIFSDITKLAELLNLTNFSNLKRVYRGIPHFITKRSSKSTKKPNVIVMKHESVLKSFTLDLHPSTKNVSDTLWFRYRRYVLIPKSNVTLQRKKLKDSDIYKMLNASISTLKKSKMYNSKCETCSVIYKMMLNDGSKIDPKLAKIDNSSVIVLMNKPKIVFLPQKSKFLSSNEKKLKKLTKNADIFVIEIDIEFLFLSSDDYEKLRGKNISKTNFLQNTPWKDVSKKFVFRIPESFNSQRKILKLSGAQTHGNLKNVFDELVNQGNIIEELEKIEFALLSKMHERKTKGSVKKNLSETTQKFNFKKSKLLETEKSINGQKGKDSAHSNEEQENKSFQDSTKRNHKNIFSEFPILISNFNEGKDDKNFWHKDKSKSFKGHKMYKETGDGTSLRSEEVSEKSGLKVDNSDVKDAFLHLRNSKPHNEDNKDLNSDASNFKNNSSKEKGHHVIKSENILNNAKKAHSNEGDKNSIKGKKEVIEKKSFFQQVDKESKTDESTKKHLVTDDAEKKSKFEHEINAFKDNNGTEQANTLQSRTPVDYNQALQPSKEKFPNYDNGNMLSNITLNDLMQELKNNLSNVNAGKHNNLEFRNRTFEAEIENRMAEKSNKLEQPEYVTKKDDDKDSMKEMSKENLKSSETADRQAFIPENKMLKLKELDKDSENVFSENNSKLGTNTQYISEVVRNEKDKMSQKRFLGNDHEILREMQGEFELKNIPDKTVNQFENKFQNIQEDTSEFLNGIERIKRSIGNLGNIDDSTIFHIAMKESEKLHPRTKRDTLAIPHNDWCSISGQIRRNADFNCTIWSFMKHCVLECHPGFTYNGQQLVEMNCQKRGNAWNPDINKPCIGTGSNKGGPHLGVPPPAQPHPPKGKPGKGPAHLIKPVPPVPQKPPPGPDDDDDDDDDDEDDEYYKDYED